MTGAVPKLWPGATVTILAGGPSLRTQNIGMLSSGALKVKILAVNDSWRLLSSFTLATGKPFVCRQCDGLGGAPNDICTMCSGVGRISNSALYFCDASWWQRSMNDNKRCSLGGGMYSFHDAIYKGQWFTGSTDFKDHPQVNALQITGQTGLETEPTGLRHGSNSGYQAINLAVHLGAKRIILLGYDMRQDGGRNNWHDEARPLASPDVYKQSMLPHFDTLVEPLRERGVEVINATPDSALECFPKISLEDALC